MNRTRLKAAGVTGLLMLMAMVGPGGCASTPPPPATAPLSSSRCYGEADVARIELLREYGETAAEAARIVGGTAADVLELEKRLRALRRSRTPAAAAGRDAVPAGCPDTIAPVTAQISPARTTP